MTYLLGDSLRLQPYISQLIRGLFVEVEIVLAAPYTVGRYLVDTVPLHCHWNPCYWGQQSFLLGQHNFYSQLAQRHLSTCCKLPWNRSFVSMCVVLPS